MIRRRSAFSLLPLLAIGASLALAAPAHAQDRRDPSYRSRPAPLRVDLGATLHWTSTRGSRVEELPVSERRNYDLFRYEGDYYAYDNDRWYMSAPDGGEFVAIDDARVPRDFATIPADHWRNYPSAWQSRREPASQGISGTLRVTFGNAPHWTSIQGTRVEEIPSYERPAYDVFRYGDSYYAYDNDRWYESPRETGNFVAIDEGSVPGEFRSIPAEHWRNYPSGWQDQRGWDRQGSYDRGSMSGGHWRSDRARWRDRRDRRGDTVQIRFGSTPHWTTIRGTRVREIRRGERPDYDMFRYGDSYYVYRDQQWYSSRYNAGEFNAIADASVPSEFSRIPRNHWRNYPTDWSRR